MGLGWGAAALSGSIWLVVPFVVAGAIGNGAAVICNQLFVQRGAPDRYRGRALATIMSTNYAVLGLAMAAAGVLTDRFGPRDVWLGAAMIYVFVAVVAFVLTRWLPVTEHEDEVIGAYGEAAASALAPAVAFPPDPNGPEPEPEPAGSAASGLERIATLLEEIERRRELEAARRTTS
jgi:MFS family permease